MENTSPLLKVVDLSFTHLGQTQPTIQNVNLTLNPGELVVLAGATGSGKSTLLNCLTGIAPEHMGGKLSGQVLCRGEEITAWSIRMRSQLMGILLQNVETQIFTDQVWEELVFGLENWNLPPGEIQDLAQSALTEFDLVEQRDWTIHQLSAGQKQRLLLACLLTRQPDMLLLDEPF
ncbi:MAG: ABC transporter ATP-binding protein, partial [Cyanobacteria bacterium P01_A01_bin.17]